MFLQCVKDWINSLELCSATMRFHQGCCVLVLQCCQDREEHNNMSILQWNIFLKIQSQCNYTTILPFLLPFVAGKKAIHPSGRYFSLAKTGKSGGCCLLALQDSMWIVMQTVWGSSQSASPGKTYHGAESSDHQDNTSQKAKSGLVKNWHTSCLVDTSHLQPRFFAPSTRLRVQGWGVKSFGNKEKIFGKLQDCLSLEGYANSRATLSLWGGRGADAAEARAEGMHCHWGKDCVLWPWSTNSQRSGRANPCTSLSAHYYF